MESADGSPTTPSSSDLGCRLQLLENELLNFKHDFQQVIFNNRELKKEISILTKENDELYEKCYDIETQGNYSNQYSRRSNVEIKVIPENIQQSDLEKHIIGVLQSIGIIIESYDIVAVHLLGKVIEGKVRSVIIRFVNRKNAELAIKRSYKLFTSSNNTFKRYFISDNLSPATWRIVNRLYKLKKKKIINDVWTFNGQVFLKINDNVNERAILVGHFDDIDYYLDV